MKNIIFIANTENLFDENKFDLYYNQMPEYRKEKINKCKFLKDKCLSLGVGIILNKMLELNNLPFEYKLDLNNKPIMDNYYYNLSHSEYYVMGIISNYKVGCDIEYNNIDLLDVNAYFNDIEINYIKSNNKVDSFYKLWTLKESFMKCIGLGFKLNLKDFSIDLINNRIIQTLNNNKYYFKTFKLNDYNYSYCVENKNITFEVKEINF